MSESNNEILDICPQEGFQTKVACSRADITIIGGAAGCGKSFIMLYIPLMYKNDKNLNASYFRVTMAQIRKAGALWDESTKLYSKLGFSPSESTLKWRLPAGGTIDFEGIEHEKDLLNYQGAAIPLMLFDELTQFTKSKFFFMVTRNRGTITLGKEGHLQKPQIFASCNPDPDSWVADMISWWIDQETGYPIPEREGVLRYFMIIEDKMVFASSKKELYERYQDQFNDEDFIKSGVHPKEMIKSLTFIGGKIYDNKKLLQSQPGYLASLKSQSVSLQDRMLRGNWKVREKETGLYSNASLDLLFNVSEDDLPPSSKNGQQRDYSDNYITCDAARFGRDLCVIMVWYRFTVIHTTIFYISEKMDIYNEIELLKRQFYVLNKNVLVDQDGVGGDVVKVGGYYGFMARRSPAPPPEENLKTHGERRNRTPENYGMRKDQCYFRSAERCNEFGLKYLLIDETCKVYFRGDKNPTYTTKIKWNNDLIDIKVLIRKQLRAILRGKAEFESNVNMYAGGDLKLVTNTKDEQKEILGHSPDFADCIMMREDFTLKVERQGAFRIT